MKNISLLQGYIYLILAIIAGIASNGFLKTTEGFTKFNATFFCITSIGFGFIGSYLYNNNDILEGININYLNPTKLKKLFSVIEFKKGKLEEEENLVFLKEDYFRIQISNPKKRSALSTKRFYSDVILSDKYFKQSYRSYKVGSLTSLQVSQINTEFLV